MINYDNVTKINKYNWNWPHIPDHPYRKLITGGTEFRKTNPLLKPYVHYLSLSLKEKCISPLLWTKYIEKKYNLQMFFLPIILWTFTLAWANTCCPPSYIFLFWKKNCMCNQDNAHDVDIFPDEKMMKWTNKPRTNQHKHCESKNYLKNYLNT